MRGGIEHRVGQKCPRCSQLFYWAPALGLCPYCDLSRDARQSGPYGGGTPCTASCCASESSTELLTAAETDFLAECEDKIRRGLSSFLEVGAALLDVRDNKLYRAQHPTFEAYCAERWSISRTRAYELMGATEVVSAIADKIDVPPPANEAQARALSVVPEDERADVWTAANERTDGKPTAAAVRAVWDEQALLRAAKEIQQERREVRLADKQATAAEIEHAVARQVADLPAVERGQWWQLGRHKLYCGDSTDLGFTVAAAGAQFAFADPPYNAGKADWDQGFKWSHDYLAGSAEIVAVTPGISAIASFFASTTMPYRWSMAAWITNGMTRGALGFGNWIYIALFSSYGGLHRNAQDHLRVTINAATTDDTAHASRKPAALMVDLIELFTKPDGLVVDPFLGSGTTLFAAEQTGRRCVGAEIEPAHCAEIIARYGAGARLL